MAMSDSHRAPGQQILTIDDLLGMTLQEILNINPNHYQVCPIDVIHAIQHINALQGFVGDALVIAPDNPVAVDDTAVGLAEAPEVAAAAAVRPPKRLRVAGAGGGGGGPDPQNGGADWDEEDLKNARKKRRTVRVGKSVHWGSAAGGGAAGGRRRKSRRHRRRR